MSETKSITQIGIIGVGKMGEALISGILNSKDAHRFSIQGTVRDPENAAKLSKQYGIPCGIDNLELAEHCNLLILCVKPSQAQKVLEHIAPKLKKETLLISVCASLTNQLLSTWTGQRCAILRAMPNTPCLIGEGMTVFSRGPHSTDAQLKIAEGIFSTVGKTAVVEESLMDGVTGLSGCGPAYIYLMIEALSEAGVKVGLSRKLSTLLAAQTFLGSAKMVLDRGDMHPAAMKDEVTTPAGCTIDGLMALEEGKIRVTLIKAVMAATQRSKTMNGSSESSR